MFLISNLFMHLMLLLWFIYEWLFWCITNHLLIWYKVDLTTMVYLYAAMCIQIGLFVDSKIIRNCKGFEPWLELPKRRTSGYVHPHIVCLFKHVSWVVCVFLAVDYSCFIGVLTQIPRGLIPLTELATPLGITILLFLVWVVQCQSKLSLWFAFCCSLTWSSRISDLKFDLFDLASFFIFLAKLSIHTFVCLQ